MDTEAIYIKNDRQVSYNELIAALDAEAATLDPDQWEGGWDAHDYLIEAVNTGVIKLAFAGDEGSCELV